jgi:hypothetical protein
MAAGAFLRGGLGRSVLRGLLSSRWFRRYALRRILYSRAFWRLVFRLGLWRFLFRSVRAYLGKRLAASSAPAVGAAYAQRGKLNRRV